MALAFVIMPITAFASSGDTTKGAINRYIYNAGQDQKNVDALTVKADKIDGGLTRVNTTAKNLAKLQKLNTKLDSTINLANSNIAKAQSVLVSDQKTNILSKADLKKIKGYLALTDKLVDSAKHQEKDLRRKLQNLKVTL